MSDKHTNQFEITFVIMMIGIAVLIASVSIIVSRINSQLREQFEYETGRDLCYEDAMDYHAYCHVRKDDDGKYHWYFIENEGAMTYDKSIERI